MKIKILIMLMSILLIVNSYDYTVFANTDYDHDALLQYDGYGEAMYESIVEQTTFITGKYTDNKEYVEQTVNQIKDYASFWKNEYSNLSDSCYQSSLMSCFGEMSQTAGAYALTVGDWVKKLFKDYGEDNDLIYNAQPDTSVYNTYFFLSSGYAYLRTGYAMKVTISGQTIHGDTRLGASYMANHIDGYRILVDVDSRGYYSQTFPFDYANRSNEENSAFHNTWVEKTVADVIRNLTKAGGSVVVYKDAKPVEIPSIESGNRNYTDINNYIQDNQPQMVVPKPTAYLSCPDGTRINMAINGGTFFDVAGQVMQVSHDGTATVDSQICKLGWEKPTIQYLGDQIAITTPDGKTIDGETGEKIILDGEIDEEIPDDCGMVCAIGKFMGGLGTIAKAIAAIPLKILDGLLELVKKILIPEENFWTTNLDSLKNKFFHDELKEVQNGVEGLENVGGGQFDDVTGSLMGVDNLTIIDSSSINMSLEKIHSWVRGFFYPLLLFFNINQMYRVIRGTSLIGIGGKKEE